MENLKETMRDVLENNILSYWLTKVKDEENGGFYGRVDGNDQVHPVAEKGAVMNARILWAFSAAYRVLKKPNILRLPPVPRIMCAIISSTGNMAASTGVLTIRVIRSIPRSRLTPSALPSMVSLSMLVQQATRKHWISPSLCIMT